MNYLDDILKGKSKEEKEAIVAKAIEYGNKWFDEMIEKGYIWTCYGFMSKEELEESGLKQSPTTGEWSCIPTIEKIAEKRELGRNRGAKYIVIDDKFLRWYRKKFGHSTMEDKIFEEAIKQQKAEPKEESWEEVNMDDIPI